MGMNRIYDFVQIERQRYSGKDNNRFAFSFGHVGRYYRFLQIVYLRYVEINAAFKDASARWQKAVMNAESGPIDDHLDGLYGASSELLIVLHLEYESFYIFGALFLDRAASFIEDYFGRPGKGRVNRHRALKNKLAGYADEKGLALPDGFADSVEFLEDYLAEFRDKEITHDKSWRSMHGTIWHPEEEVRLFKTKIYPRDGDKQIEGKQPSELLAAIEEYVDGIISLIETNRHRTQYQRGE